MKNFLYNPRYDWGYYIKTSVPPNAIRPVLGYNFMKREQLFMTYLQQTKG